MGLQDMLLRKMLQSKMAGVPKEEQDRIFDIIQKHPDLFQKIGLEVQSAMKSGKDQNAAVMDVIAKYKDDLEKIKSSN